MKVNAALAESYGRKDKIEMGDLQKSVDQAMKDEGFQLALKELRAIPEPASGETPSNDQTSAQSNASAEKSSQ